MKFLEAKRLTSEGENKALGGPDEDKSAATPKRHQRGISAPSPSTPKEEVGPTASPQAKQLAKEQNIDLATLKGTGSGGVITAGDVRKAIEEKGGNPASSKAFDTGSGG